MKSIQIPVAPMTDDEVITWVGVQIVALQTMEEWQDAVNAAHEFALLGPAMKAFGLVNDNQLRLAGRLLDLARNRGIQPDIVTPEATHQYKAFLVDRGFLDGKDRFRGFSKTLGGF